MGASTFHRARTPLLVGILLVATAGFLSALVPARSAEPGLPVDTPATSDSVTLTSDQLQAIQIVPAGRHAFQEETQAIGSVALPDDVALIQAEATLVSAAATFTLTNKELARASGLYASNGGVAQRELEQATSDQESAAAALRAARDAASALGASQADIDAIVASGQMPHSTISSTAVRWVMAEVAEDDSPLVHVGQAVRVSLATYPGHEFRGTVSKVYAALDPDTHHLAVRCRLSDAPAGLRPGMLATVVIELSPQRSATALPATGVVRNDDGSLTAWVTADRHHFTPRTITIGLQQDGYDEILTGLKPGELTVSNGAVFLSNMLSAPPAD